MIICRCNCLSLLALIAACSPAEKENNADLHRIQQISNTELASEEFQKFVEVGQPQLEKLRRELASAGFRHSTSPNENDPGCESFIWARNETAEPVIMIASICNGRVETSVGVPNP